MNRAAFLLLLVSAFPGGISAAAESEPSFTYSYPTQYSSSITKRTDPENRFLTDGNHATCVDSAGAIDEFFILVKRRTSTPLRGAEVTISDPDYPKRTLGFHPWDMRVYLPDAEGRYAPIPTLILPLEFPNEQTPSCRVNFPEAVTAKELKIGFVPTHHQVRIAELRLIPGEPGAASPAVPRVSNDDGGAIRGIPPLPAECDEIDYRPSMEVGTAMHTLHTDFFYPSSGRFRSNWNVEMILPPLLDGNFGIVRESLYSAFFIGEGIARNDMNVTENRARVEHTFRLYQKYGVRIIACIMYSRSDPKSVAEFNTWLLELARKFPCLTAIEIDNEPNASRSPEDYAQLVKRAASELRAGGLPDRVKLLAGSLAGYGRRHFGDSTQDAGKSPEERSFAWFADALRCGILEFVDGVSFHPYSQGAPECGRDEIAPDRSKDGFHRQITAFRALVESFSPAGKRMDFYITEFGYSLRSRWLAQTSQNTELNMHRAADWISRHAFLIADEIVSGFPLKAYCIYSLKCDPVWAHEANYGLVSENTLRRNPSFAMMRKMATDYGRAAEEFAPEPRLKPEFSINAECVYSTRWRRKSDGAWVLGFWRMDQYQQHDQDFSSFVTLRVPSGEIVSHVTLDSFAEPAPRRLGFVQEGDELRLPVEVRRSVSTLTVEFGGTERRKPVVFMPENVTRWTRSVGPVKHSLKRGASIEFTLLPDTWTWVFCCTSGVRQLSGDCPNPSVIELEVENNFPDGIEPVILLSFADGREESVPLLPKGVKTHGGSFCRLPLTDFPSIRAGKYGWGDVVMLKYGGRGKNPAGETGEFRIKTLRLHPARRMQAPSDSAGNIP